MKKKLATLAAIMMMATVSTTISYACVSGYGTASINVIEAFWPWESDKAEAEMTRCSCNPVDNDLMVWLHVQYRSGNNYYWDPGETTYVYDHDTDTDSVYISITRSGNTIRYAQAKYFAKCGTNATNEFQRQYWVLDD